jgi:mRNA-degrading endonuclease toxin of MazEF toxin-antitoxin module
MMKSGWVFRRGDLYLANLGKPEGSRQGGVRPIVVLQNDVGNYYALTLTLAPLTSKIEKKKQQPTHYLLRKAKGLQRPSTVLAEQLGTFDKSCIIRYLGWVSGGQIHGIDKAVKVQFSYYIPEKCIRDGHCHYGRYYEQKEAKQNERIPGGQT